MCFCWNWMMDDLLVWKGSMCQCPPPGLGAIFSVVNDQAFHSLDIPTHEPPPHLRHLSPPPPQRPDSPPPQNPRTPPPPSSVSSRQPPPPAWSPQPRCCSDYCLLDKEDLDKDKVFMILKGKIIEAISSDNLWTKNWDEEPLPGNLSMNAANIMMSQLYSMLFYYISSILILWLIISMT